MQGEPYIRLSVFLGILLVMGLWEAIGPRRPLTTSKSARWLSNLSLVFINSMAVRIGFGLGAVGVALESHRLGWGLLNKLAAPGWLAVLLSILALDLVLYLQHVMFHAVPLLWRLHQVHHADPDLDVTTGIRFHTLEIGLSMGIKSAAILLLGAPPLAVLIFEVLLNATSMFSHSNVLIPFWLDRILRLVVVTPDMHVIHHSQIVAETNSNYGFNLPWWDFLLGTYRRQPQEGHEAMTIGISHLRDELEVDRLPRMLALPFRSHTALDSMESEKDSEHLPAGSAPKEPP